jgi:YVTN family beta-propeller protein
MQVRIHLLIALNTVALCTVTLSGCATNQHPQTAADKGMSMSGTTMQSGFAQAMMQSMADMNKNMMAAPMTGDPDHDFVAMMIPHHQGAIDMAKPYLLYGKDPTLRRLAQEIIVAQKQEIDVMQLRLAAFQARALTVAPGVQQVATFIPVSGHDRVYTADQTSNTVSVIDPGTNKLLGIIRLGDPVPGALSPLYHGQLLVHGMGFSPDHRTIAVVSIGSNSITFIDTETNAVKGVVYIGRSPHEAFFTPDGKELWATVRGEDYISVIDPVAMKETRRIQTANGPGMVLFRPDGKYAFIPSSFTPELDVVDLQSSQIVARVPQASPFSPNLAVSRDGTEVWFTLKDSGKNQVMNGELPFNILATLDTGPISNDVTLVDNGDGKFAYVSVGEENLVKVYRRGSKPELTASIPTGDLPHGLWGSDDGNRVYVGLENQDAVAAIDTHTNTVLTTIPVGQQPQALVYVPDAVPTGDGTSNLLPLGDAGKASHLTMEASDRTKPLAHATVSVNELGTLDLLEAAVSGLKPGHTFTLLLVASRVAPFGHKEALVTFKTNVSGVQVVQAIAPLREVLSVRKDNHENAVQRFLLITDTDTGTAELIQSNNTLTR